MNTEKLIESEEKLAEDIKQQLTDSGYEVNDAATAKEVIESYLNDSEVQENALYWAKQFEDRFHGNWFTIEKVMKKTHFKKIQDALGVLQIISLAGYCHVTKDNGIVKYKITINKSQKLQYMEKEKERLEAAYKEDLNRLNGEFNLRNQALENEIQKLKDTLN